MEMKPNFDFEGFGIGVEPTNTVAGFTAHTEQLLKQAEQAQQSKGLFTVKSASSWLEQAKTRPIPKMLFDVFWFEGELCILYADTNLGKSILAVQIGNSISKGEPIRGFKLETPKQPILYFDFELSDKQFEGRYCVKNETEQRYEQHYGFDENFIRVEINPDAPMPENQTFEDYFNYSLERSITETGAKVLIIDNLTYLKNGTETAKDALPLMKHLKALKSKYNISILILAHTPKRDLSKPINRNDLQGSKMLINFCDSSFTIGESHSDKNIRYLKQMKQRNTEQIYDAENICVCEVSKPLNFLLFGFVGFGKEYDHLKQYTEKDKESITQKVRELSQQGKTQRAISTEMSISLGAVNKYLKL